MTRVLDSFKVRSGNKILDYRLGEDLNLRKVELFFQETYQIKKLWKEPRHVLGILVKDDKVYFLKLATSEGISIVTRNEYHWNNYFNNYSSNNKYLVPRNYDSGLYENKYFYLITDFFNGELLCETRSDIKTSDLVNYIPQIIEFFEIIQQLPVTDFSDNRFDNMDYKKRFLDKTRCWFNDIPSNISKKFDLRSLLEIVEKGLSELSAKPRHGDFTPWHMIKLQDKRLGLIDGEHAVSNGIEGYDICYFIQRIFSVLKNPRLAINIYSRLKKKGYQANRLKTVLAARTIGGFLDESLVRKSDYKYAVSFKAWVEEIS